MDLLILGGTVFLGRHLIATALTRGHGVTLFNRGRHNPELFPEVEKLRGDRDRDLTPLTGRKWDAVIDTCGYVPRVVEHSARLLASAVDHYTFISSISVYADFSRAGLTEESPVRVLDDPTVEEITNETYGALKALCEQAAEAAMPGRVLTIRPGLIVGPHDPTDRFTYWPVRISSGGPTLTPGGADVPVQFIDVRDLASWTLDMVEARTTGVVQATGPASTMTLGDFLATCRSITHSDAEFIWADEAFLAENEVAPFTEMPMWVPGALQGINQADCRKAIAAGLSFRAPTTTILDTLDWVQERSTGELKAGLASAREAELLAKVQTDLDG